MAVKKTAPGKVSPLKEARHIALVGDSREKVRRSKGMIRQSKTKSAVSRNTISLSRDLVQSRSEMNRS